MLPLIRASCSCTFDFTWFNKCASVLSFVAISHGVWGWRGRGGRLVGGDGGREWGQRRRLSQGVGVERGG